MHGNQLTLFASDGSQELHSVVVQKVEARLDEKRTRAEEKAFLTAEVRKLINMLHKRTGRSHAQLHSQINAQQKVKSQTTCTEKQLRERISIIRKMLS